MNCDVNFYDALNFLRFL